MNETFTVERLVGGALKIMSDSAWLPGGVMVVKSGEQYTLDMPGLGATQVRTSVMKVCTSLFLFKGIGHEGCDEWNQTSKMMGKTVSIKERLSGDFMITVRLPSYKILDTYF